MRAEYVEKKKVIEKKYQTKKKALQQRLQAISATISTYLYSDELSRFISALSEDRKVFCSSNKEMLFRCDEVNIISYGVVKYSFPTPIGFSSTISEIAKGLYDAESQTIDIPIGFNVNTGSVITAEYTNDNEQLLLSGIQNIILNVARHSQKIFSNIVFFDPLRFNSSSLGCLSPLSIGESSFIDNVPSSMEEAKRKLSSMIATETEEEREFGDRSLSENGNKLFIFHDFPKSYDSVMISQIQQLCVNATHYGVTVILCQNTSQKSVYSSFDAELIKTISTNIASLNNKFFMCEYDGQTQAMFTWYQSPDSLPEDIVKKYIDDKPVVDTGNIYERRIGFQNNIAYKKGVRKLRNIPFGVDKRGNIMYIDFENSNFATFICGASRSGKSTLLHTIISGVIQNNHPDDVEIWLVDFKMTEFSRYINHCPPHVRYIILDESPELVYDIIDRLTEIMQKRQNIFKGKWLKLSEVPPEKYMPAMFVVIDEFSVMSTIVAESIVNGGENYSIKLQTLLAKGAALGMHFIFASQGFTSGTRGLTPFSKSQIQQRLAMKTEFQEIKDTLDLKSASDNDKAMMEQLPVHHALRRVPMDARGNHLELAYILYISDYTKQEQQIDAIRRSLSPAPKYNVDGLSEYIDKKTMIVDGNNYLAFRDKRREFEKYLDSHERVLQDISAFALFVGEPRRIMSSYPIEISNEFCENILILSPVSETMAASSVIMSVEQSLDMQNVKMEYWTTKKAPVYRQVIVECGSLNRSLTTLDKICEQIREIKENIQHKVEEKKVFVLVGFESLLTDMSYEEDRESSLRSSSVKLAASYDSFEKRAEGEPDLLSLLSGDFEMAPVQQTPNKQSMADIDRSEDHSTSYDARDDLKYIITHGPRLGYHFIMLFNSSAEISQSKIDLSLFKHKLLFRTAKSDAMSIIGNSNAKIVSELDDHSFRYSNGLDELTFRPYLHQGLSWDGWEMTSEGITNSAGEEEYLL